MITMDKDFNDIKEVFISHYIKTNQLLTIEEFNRTRPAHLKRLKYYFNDYLIDYNKLVFDYLGFVKIVNKKHSKNRIYNKEVLLETFKSKSEKMIKEGNNLLSKNIKKDFGISLKELKTVFNWNFIELHEELNVEHSLSLIRQNKKFDWSIACTNKVK